MTTALRSDRVVLPSGVRPATVLIDEGAISAVLSGTAPLPRDVELHDVTGLVVSPGLVDSHVHVNEPGRTQWEGFATATAAAAAGGVTTIVDMPLNSIPATTTVGALAEKRAAAQDQVVVDVAFWGGITSDDTSSVAPLVAAGVCGFKVFLVPSGVDEFCSIGPGELERALAVTARLGVPVIVHAEAPGPLERAPAPQGRSYAAYVASRPPEAEVEAVQSVIDAVRTTGGRAHILHLSAQECLPLLRSARAEGLPITVETCPHYLSLSAEDIPDGATQCKCAPPVRSEANRAALWRALGDGVIDCMVSDHSPASPEVKSLDTGDFGTAWGGISGIQTSLPVVWTAARQLGYGLVDMARWQSATPARIAGLPQKGGIDVGKDADLVVWDPDAEFVVKAEDLLQRHKISPWHGKRLSGVVAQTWLRGERVEQAAPPRGLLLNRGVSVGAGA
ncbi:allantoinase [Motilibacter rhizosphaerae]|uniref:allantoinase n=1 Tax=Motilibacter rhizosphaerae TaxID=598652 RepID=A0A4Q7NWK5_9ACTN|nr:allantoinase AllB [Motilibacter rhizosphaerae]RZS91681.1 allantoinase [Motilibacter rhizosphaerae]